MRQSWVVILCLLLGSARAQTSPADDLILSLQADLRPALLVTREEMLKDLDRLETAAGAAYAGPDLANVLHEVRAQVPWLSTPQLFCLQLQQAFERVRDSHLRAELINQGCSREGRDVAGKVGANLRAQANTWGARKVEGSALTVLAIPEFLPGADSSWSGFLKEVQDLKAAKHAFVLDLRGNLGGDDRMAQAMARVLYGLTDAEPVPTPLESRLSKQTAEAFALRANAWAVEILQSRFDGQTQDKALQLRLNERRKTLGWMAKAKTGNYPPISIYEYSQPELSGKEVFQAPVYVLIDRGCASTCELMLQYLEALPQRILVGEHTMGVVVYGEVGQLVLPASKTIVTLATTSARYRDDRAIEKQGYVPAIQVAPGDDALDSVLALIH